MNSECYYKDSELWIIGKELFSRWPGVTPKSLLGRILQEYSFDCPQIRAVVGCIFDERVGRVVPGPMWSERELGVLYSHRSSEEIRSAIEGRMFFNMLDVKEYEEDHPEVLLMIGQDEQADNSADDLILQFGIAAQRLYESMKMRLKSEGITLTRSEKTKRRVVTVSIFDDDPAQFSPLKKEHIDIPEPYDSSQTQHNRKMIGAILSTAFTEEGSDYQALYRRFKKLYARFKKNKPSK